MPRLPRVDHPGRLYHVMNRGLARRTVFETRRDVRYFLSLLARAVRERRIEVVAFAIMTTHFHLLVRSVDGQLSETMRRVLNAYVRWFNRSRRRDGPLFRGRFRSVLVSSPRQLWYTMRYIDANPVEAGLAAAAEDYPNGSARLHGDLARRPPWLDAAIVDRATESGIRRGLSRLEAYRRAFEPRLSPRLRAFVVGRIERGRRDRGVGSDLLALSDSRLDDWMRRKAALGDGTRAGVPLVTADALIEALTEYVRSNPQFDTVRSPGNEHSTLRILCAGLLRDLAGERVREVAQRLKCSAPTVSRLHELHRRLVAEEGVYLADATKVIRLALGRDRWAQPIEEAVWPLILREG